MGRVRSSKRWVRDDNVIFVLSSDYPRIMLESSLFWRKFSHPCYFVYGGCSICSCWSFIPTHCTPSNSIASFYRSHDSISIWFHIASHHIAWHDRTLQNMTRHDVTWQETKKHKTSTWHDMPLHHMTWHVATLTTSPYLTSPDTQPHYFISPRHRPHDIITHHITARGVTTAERLKADWHQKLFLRHHARLNPTPLRPIKVHDITLHQITWERLTSRSMT